MAAETSFRAFRAATAASAGVERLSSGAPRAIVEKLRAAMTFEKCILSKLLVEIRRTGLLVF